MDIKLAVLADGANATAEGKLNILGIFNALHAPNFPCVHPQMCLVLRFEATRAEEGKTRNIEIQLADDDGQKVFAINASLVIPKGQPGMPIRLDHILVLERRALRARGRLCLQRPDRRRPEGVGGSQADREQGGGRRAGPAPSRDTAEPGLAVALRDR